MRFNEKQQLSQRGENQLFGVDFHDFVQQESNATSMELASEFGLSLGEIRQLKRKIGRS
ncbi:hypothetical protein [Bacillus sp. HMF5848]|uniref:hypothetical protein n=1 Tax=Bacillus sp. HMF5848 TaxID=2495421 RepID=UPI00163A2E60|nr:hypothetical protein [Bacillus sp. HMF5848]